MYCNERWMSRSVDPNPLDLVSPDIEQILIGMKSFTGALRQGQRIAKE